MQKQKEKHEFVEEVMVKTNLITGKFMHPRKKKCLSNNPALHWETGHGSD